MARYFFHIENDDPFADEDGLDLEHSDAARLEAAKLLSQLVSDRPEDIWLDETLAITVKDETGLTLFVLDLAVTTSPAAPPCRLTRRRP